MLFGTVECTLTNGRIVTTDRAGRMVFSGPEKLQLYYVHLDASPGIVAPGEEYCVGRRREPEDSVGSLLSELLCKLLDITTQSQAS